MKILIVFFGFASGAGEVYISDPIPADECHAIEAGAIWSEPADNPDAEFATMIMPMCFDMDDPIGALIEVLNGTL